MFFLAFLILLAAGACGGGRSLDAGATAVSVPPVNADSGVIPSIPADREISGRKGGGPPEKGNNLRVWGKNYLQEYNGTVVKKSLVLDPGSDSDAWATYGFSRLGDLQPQVLSVEAYPAELGDEYWVGVANYTTNTWEWFGPTNMVEYNIDLLASGDSYASQEGNFYFILMVYTGNVIEHKQSTLTLGSYQEPAAPGAPSNLRASDGEFYDHVNITWDSGAGATGYEVYRTTDDPRTPPPGGTGDPDVTWELLGTTEDTAFADYDVVPGDIYWYRARSYNDIGVSDYSNFDYGYAATEPPPPPEYDISGYALDGGGTGVAGVTVYLAGPYGLVTTDTDGDGYYFANVEGPGTYIVAPYDPENYFDPWYKTVDVNIDNPSAQADFALGNGELPVDRLWGFTYGTDIPGYPPGGVSSLPLPGVTLTVTDLQTQATYETASGDNGYWEQAGLSAGSYEVYPSLEGYTFDPVVDYATIDGAQVPPPLIFYVHYGVGGGQG
jgi:hypothetical protein